MEFDFKGGTGSTIKESFENRKQYKEHAALKNVEMLDTLYQNCNYGLLNEDYEPVCLNTDENLTNLSKFSDAKAGLYAVNFVVRTFEDFRRYYVATTIDKGLNFPPVIDQPVPTRAFSNFDSTWARYIETQIDNYARLLVNDLHNIEDHKTILSNLISTNTEEFPITKSGFILSNKCPMSVSGLTIELTELNYDQDTEKNQFFNSYEYGCFAEVASEMGFYVDKNVPWRLIANLESPVMRQQILRLFPDTTPEKILNKTYRKKTHFEDISSVYYFYGKTLQRALATLGIEYTPAYSQEFLIEETLRIRMSETGMDMGDFQKMREDVLNMHRSYSASHPNNPLKPAAAKIGKFCSEKIREIYLAKSQKNSYSRNTLKEIM
jgi:hypothetical protein